MSTLRKLCICTSLLSVVILGNSGPASASRARAVVTHDGVAYQVQDITHANLQWYSKSMPTVAKAEPHALIQWNTTTTDITATWPDASDPTWKLPVKVQVEFACIRYHESRNHLTSIEPTSMAEGWYQFTPYIWSYARSNIPGLPATPIQATGDQQSEVAVWYYQRNHGLYPEWAADMSACSQCGYPQMEGVAWVRFPPEEPES